ncbi:unnamed protein product [Phytophthora lilii]|uniref:Unnamed protein product n=1 Tax=Phytophthora lilii TaxID=2077276 RepID=A0A9W6XX34_9STRA|nr:unnamed protein product [Phytophthora lilii]
MINRGTRSVVGKPDPPALVIGAVFDQLDEKFVVSIRINEIRPIADQSGLDHAIDIGVAVNTVLQGDADGIGCCCGWDLNFKSSIAISKCINIKLRIIHDDRLNTHLSVLERSRCWESIAVLVVEPIWHKVLGRNADNRAHNSWVSCVYS